MTELLLRQGAPDLGLAKPARAPIRANKSDRTETAGGLSMQLIDSLDGFEALEADWNELLAASGNPCHIFQGFNWCWHWCRHYLGDGRKGPSLAIVTGRLAGRLVLLMPFVVERRAGLNELTWLGEPVSQYGDIVAAPEAAAGETLLAAWRWSVAAAGADVANLRRVRGDAVAAPLLAALASNVTATEEAPFLSLGNDTSFPGWVERRQPRGRKNRSRQARRMAEMGAMTFEEHAGTAEASRLAAEAIAMKRASLDAKAAISLSLNDERFEAFFSDAAAGLGRPAGVRIMALKSDGAPAALKILIENEAASFLHVAVFDPRFVKCAAGALLLEHVVATTIASGRETLDLLPPRHEYKLDFADGVVLVHDHALPMSAKGWLYARGYLGLRRRVKSVVEAMPAPVRRALVRVIG